MFFGCCENPAFGDICGQMQIIFPDASFDVIPLCFIEYAAMTIDDLEMPAEQCTKIFPLPFSDVNALSMRS